MRFTASLLALLLAFSTPAWADAPSISDITKDRVYGNPNAPVTIIEYASLTCGHCADFNTKTKPQLEEFFKNGKAKLIFRDFPLDGAALKAAAVARCLPAAQYYPFINLLFSRQQQWAGSPNVDDALTKLAGLAGLDAATAKLCMTDKKILDAVAQQRQEAEKKFNITGTPAFVFNNGAEKLSGAQPVEKFAAIINKLGTAATTSTPAAPATQH